MDAFDADALIYAANPNDSLGERVRRLLTSGSSVRGMGSALLMPEVLIKPTRRNDHRETRDLRSILAHLDLYDVTTPISNLAVDLGAKYGLKTPDAVHLSTAVLAGADRFITNNRRDFVKDIAEVDVVYPDELPAA